MLLKPKVKLITGEGTILLVEDEESLVSMFKQMLEKLGYRMLEAKTGKEAIEPAKSFDGSRVYPLIMELRPSLKVIVVSGYAIDGPVQAILDAGAEGFIQKPFWFSLFSKKLKDVLKG